jgi:hypothetical protein
MSEHLPRISRDQQERSPTAIFDRSIPIHDLRADGKDSPRRTVPGATVNPFPSLEPGG